MKPKSVEDLIIDELDKLVSTRTDLIVSGHVADFAEYRHLAGVITGLLTAREVVKSLLNRYREYDE